MSSGMSGLESLCLPGVPPAPSAVFRLRALAEGVPPGEDVMVIDAKEYLTTEARRTRPRSRSGMRVTQFVIGSGGECLSVKDALGPDSPGVKTLFVPLETKHDGTTNADQVLTSLCFLLKKKGMAPTIRASQVVQNASDATFAVAKRIHRSDQNGKRRKAR